MFKIVKMVGFYCKKTAFMIHYTCLDMEAYRSGRTGTHSKCVWRVIVTRVRISPLPPTWRCSRERLLSQSSLVARFGPVGLAERRISPLPPTWHCSRERLLSQSSLVAHFGLAGLAERRIFPLPPTWRYSRERLPSQSSRQVFFIIYINKIILSFLIS